MGKQAADLLQSVIAGASAKFSGVVATIVGIVMLIATASGVFAQTGVVPGETIVVAREQLVDDQRLDEDRMLVNETRAESGPIDQRTEQIEVGIRREHDIQPASGLETLARLVE
jgi:hypothetical protein